MEVEHQVANQIAKQEFEFIALCALVFCLAIAEQILQKKPQTNEVLEKLRGLREKIYSEVVGSKEKDKSFNPKKIDGLMKGRLYSSTELSPQIEKIKFNSDISQQIEWFNNLDAFSKEEQGVLSSAKKFQCAFCEIMINEASFIEACTKQLPIKSLQNSARNYALNHPNEKQAAEAFCSFLDRYAQLKNSFGNPPLAHVFFAAYEGSTFHFSKLLDAFESVGFSDNLSGPRRLIAKEYTKQLPFLEKLESYDTDQTELVLNMREVKDILIKPVQRIAQYLLTFNEVGLNFLAIHSYLPPSKTNVLSPERFKGVKETLTNLNLQVNRTQDKDFTITQAIEFGKNEQHKIAYQFLSSVQLNLEQFYNQAEKAQTLKNAWRYSYSWKDFFKNIFTQRRLSRTKTIIDTLRSATDSLANKFHHKQALTEKDIPDVSKILQGAIDTINTERKGKFLPRFFQPKSTVKNRLKTAMAAWESLSVKNK